MDESIQQILLAHGGGGSLTHELIEEVFVPAFRNEALDDLSDSAVLPAPPEGHKLAMTTDAYVVSPYFFPGGDIGTLSICGTVNDLAVVGARPISLTCAFVLEEGLPIADLRTVVASMAEAAKRAGIQLVAGDTKVVPKGKADGVFITTAGIGHLPRDRRLGPASIREGDAILVSGTLGDHGTTIMATRENLGISSDLVSDVAPLNGLIASLFDAGVQIHAMRDPTRGGLAQTLVEMAAAAKLRFDIEEEAIPVLPSVQAVCDMLGLDVLQVANEGKLALFVPAKDAKKALDVLTAHELGRHAAVIGSVSKGRPSVVLQTATGGARLVEAPTGELLPRIC